MKNKLYKCTSKSQFISLIEWHNHTYNSNKFPLIFSPPPFRCVACYAVSSRSESPSQVSRLPRHVPDPKLRYPHYLRRFPPRSFFRYHQLHKFSVRSRKHSLHFQPSPLSFSLFILLSLFFTPLGHLKHKFSLAAR